MNLTKKKLENVMTNLILKGEAGFHCEGEHNVGRLYSRSGEEEQGVRRLHHKGGYCR